MHCTCCGHSIPPVIESAPYCPYCGEERAASKSGDAASGSRSEQTFADSSASELCLAFDPQIGFALIGAHRPDDGEPRLRAYDLHNQRVAWEALVGEPRLGDVDAGSLAVRGRNVFVALGRGLLVLDLLTGQQKWGAEFTDDLDSDRAYTAKRGLRVVDAVPPGHPGAVLFFTTDDTIASFDRDTGRPLWREVRESLPREAVAIEEAGLVVFQSPVEVLNPFQQQPLLKTTGRIERADVEGRYGLWQVDNWGFFERDGIVVHDFVTNKELLFEPVEHLEDDVPVVMGHNRVFAATESGKKLFAGPNGRAVDLKEGFHIRAMTMAGPTLFVLLEKTPGTGYRRVLGVDPQTLGVRFDLGELTTEPDDHWTQQMRSNGQLAVVVTSPSDDDDDCELWGVDPGGRVLWKADVGCWRGHDFLGGHVVACSSDRWQILRPDNGQPVAVYSDPG